jgi:tetrahydrodipicolinate N-succinyltransferase
MQEPLAEKIDVENRDITLGMIISRLDQLMESNTKEHNLITERLNENDKNVVILKFSRCVYSWLDNKGVVKWAAVACSVAIIDFFVRHYS